MNKNNDYKKNRSRKQDRKILIMLLALVMMLSGSLMNPVAAYANYTKCDKGFVYNNGLNGIYISINTAPYNTIFIDRRYQGNFVSVAYDYDGCGWFATARARQLTGKSQMNYIWAAQNWWTRYTQFGFKRVQKGGGIPKGKSIAVWYPSNVHPYGHVAIVEKVNGNTITLSEGGASNAWFSPRPNLKPYGYCILRQTTKNSLESLGKFMGYIDLGVGAPKEISPTGLTVTSKVSVAINGTAQVNATYKPANTSASKKGIAWTSSNTRIATVDKNGKVTGKAAGTATITATCTANKKATASCKVTVTKKILSTSVSISKKSLTLNSGNSATLTASVNPVKASSKSIKWTTSDPTVATVTRNGKVKAVAPGTAVITAAADDGNSKAACTVTVLMANGVYRLKHVGTGKMMNYAWGWREFAYKPIFLDKRDGSVEQTFRFRHISNGKYEVDIMHKEGGVMNVWTSKTVANGQKIGSWVKTNDDTQRFLVTHVGNGKYILRSAQNSNLAVAPDGSARGYLKLVNYNRNDKNQQWTFEKVN